MKNFLKMLGTAILFFGLSSSATAANTANKGLTQLSNKPLIDSPYALDCKDSDKGKNCSLVNKDKYGISKLPDTGTGTTFGSAITTDSIGNVYVTGYTTVGINGQQQHGYEDYFVIKYNASGQMDWVQQVGSYWGNTVGYGITTDTSGNVYVTGFTDVGINGQQQYGKDDYFLVKYDTNGKLQWAQQVGATGGITIGRGIAVDDSGNVFITGYTSVAINNKPLHGLNDYFIAAYRTDGSLIFADQVGAAGGDTEGRGIGIDNRGNIYITGYTNVGINGQQQHGNYDYFIVKYYKNSIKWSQQIGVVNGKTLGLGLKVDNKGSIYLTGQTNIGINRQKQYGFVDFFIVKYTASGIRIWTRQVGAAGGASYGQGVTTDIGGNVYITGSTTRGINGQSQHGADDYFIVKYDIMGKEQWTQQVGVIGGLLTNSYGIATALTDGYGIATDYIGNVYITGSTTIGLNGQPQNGAYDAFTTSYNPDGTLRWNRQVGG